MAGLVAGLLFVGVMSFYAAFEAWDDYQIPEGRLMCALGVVCCTAAAIITVSV